MNLGKKVATFGGGATAAASTAAHNASASAHGFGVYTVAQLNAFTSANRPTGCVYCSDCLVPEGVGAPVVWNGTKWVTTCSGIETTTDMLTFFRSMATAGRNAMSASTVFYNQSSVPFGPNVTASSGAGAGTLYDAQANYWLTGTVSATAAVADQAYVHAVNFGPAMGGIAAAYVCEDVWFSALSSPEEEYSYRRGFLNKAASNFGADEVGIAYDRGNALGALNAGNSANWIAYTRVGSVNGSPVVSTVAPATTRGTRQRIEVFLQPGDAQVYLSGTLLAQFTALVPASLSADYIVSGKSVLAKSIGTGDRARNATRRFFGVRYM